MKMPSGAIRHAQRGAAMIEFALSLPVIILVIAGIVDLSSYLTAIYNIERACRDAARVGAITIDGTPPIGDDMQAAAVTHVTDVLRHIHLDPARARTATSWQIGPQGYFYLTVSLDYPFTAPFGLFPHVDDGLSASFTTMTLVQP